MTELIIRTSDRNQFRRCRVAWDYGSKIRRNYQTVKPIEPLDFGSAMHEAFEVLYDPKRWHDPDRALVLVEAHAAFMRWMVKWEARLKKLKQWDAQKDRHAELVQLGKGMIDNYVIWVADGDKDRYWEPIFTEIEFEIPIPVSKENRYYVNNGPRGFLYTRLLKDGQFSHHDYLHKYVDDEAVPVLYQGRIDLIILDTQTNRNWIVDHKTAAQFGNTTWFDMDTQTRSYGWAAKRVLGVDIEGVMFNRVRKKLPTFKELKDGGLSQAASQDVDPSLYRYELQRRGLNEAHYRDFLSRFKGQPYFQRLEALHSDGAFEQTERAIIQEAMEMLGRPFIYPSPDMFNCSNCQFYAPCQAMHDGQDDQWVLDHSGGFINRSQVETEEVKNF